MDSIDAIVDLVESDCSNFLHSRENFYWRLVHRIWMTIAFPTQEMLPDGWWTL